MNCAPLELLVVSTIPRQGSMLAYMLNAMNSLGKLSGGREVSSKERLKPPKPPDICSKCSVVEILHLAGKAYSSCRYRLQSCFQSVVLMPKLCVVLVKSSYLR